MSKSGLKEAMNLLQVNKPLKLASRAPTFTPPPITPANQTTVENPTQVENTSGVILQTQVKNMAEVENITLVETQTQVAKTIQAESATPDIKVTEVTKPTVVLIETQVATQTGVDLDSLVVKQTEVKNHTQVPKETLVSKTTEVVRPTETHTDQPSANRRAIEQDSSVALEARASEGLEKGYTRLPNSVLMKMANGDLTRGEIKILLLIARFTISFQRKLAPLSKTVLERQSGLRGAGVLEALSGLVEKKMIVKEQGDQHKPNMLGLVLPEDWDQLIGKSETSLAKPTSVQKAIEVSKQTQVINPTPVTQAASGEVTKPTSALVVNPSPFKDTKIYSNKNSHSQLPEILKKYFAELKPAKKRESELKLFQELCLDYETTDVADCFSIVRERGVGSESEPCHSPMAFLSQAIAGVLIEVEQNRIKAKGRQARQESIMEANRKRAESEAHEAAEWEMKERAFHEAFPEESKRTDILAKLCEDLPFKLSGEAARIMGIGKWWESEKH